MSETTTPAGPLFKPPVLIDLITGKLKADGANARGMYKLGDAKLDGPTIKAMALGIGAAQRELDDWAGTLTIDGMMDDAAAKQIGEEKIAKLRSRVRAAAGATIADLISAVLAGTWVREGVILCPLNRPIEPWVHWAHLAIIKRSPWISYDQVHFPSLPYARNKLVQSFLTTEAQWSWWLDGDTVPPIGDPGSMYNRFGANPAFVKPEFAGLNTFDKLTARQKTIIGTVVADKHAGNRLIIQPDLNPQNDADRQLVKLLKKEGPQDKVIQVPYVGTGCTLVHRSVYMDIMKKFPERGPKTAGEPFNFFGSGNGMDAEGEDIAFCKLASESGHPAFLDLAVWCAHVGTHSFYPQAQV